MRRSAAPLLAFALLAAGCSSDDASTTTTTTADAGPTTTGDAGPTTTAGGTTTTAADGGCSTDLAVVNADAETTLSLEDRALEPVSILADEGPHPDNTVDYDMSLSLAISEVEIVEDPQFGLGIPIGAPENLTGDAYYLALSFQSDDGPVAAGQVYDDRFLPGDPVMGETDDTSGTTTTTAAPAEPGRDGKLNFVLAHHGTDRLLPGQVTVTLTAITDEQVCGEISMGTETDLQQFIGIEGTFVAERIQALEG